MAAPHYSPTSNVWGSSSSTSSWHLPFSEFSITATPEETKWYLAVVLICIFLTTNYYFLKAFYFLYRSVVNSVVLVSDFLMFSRSVMSNCLRPHGLQHARPLCPSPTPRVCSNSCPLSWWCHPTSWSSVIPFSSCLQSFPASGSFPVSQFLTSGGQSIGVSASASVLPMDIQGWSPLGWTGWISLLSRELLRIFSSTSLKASVLWLSVFFMVHSHLSMTAGKTVYVRAQLCLTLCNSTDCSPPGSSVHGLFQTRILEWVAVSSSRGSSQPRDWTHCIDRWILHH